LFIRDFSSKKVSISYLRDYLVYYYISFVKHNVSGDYRSFDDF